MSAPATTSALSLSLQLFARAPLPQTPITPIRSLSTWSSLRKRRAFRPLAPRAYPRDTLHGRFLPEQRHYLRPHADSRSSCHIKKRRRHNATVIAIRLYETLVRKALVQTADADAPHEVNLAPNRLHSAGRIRATLVRRHAYHTASLRPTHKHAHGICQKPSKHPTSSHFFSCHLNHHSGSSQHWLIFVVFPDRARAQCNEE